jgi:hypothetical protein
MIFPLNFCIYFLFPLLRLYTEPNVVCSFTRSKIVGLVYLYSFSSKILYISVLLKNFIFLLPMGHL